MGVLTSVERLLTICLNTELERGYSPQGRSSVLFAALYHLLAVCV